jgi:hypothetical protein
LKQCEDADNAQSAGTYCLLQAMTKHQQRHHKSSMDYFNVPSVAHELNLEQQHAAYRSLNGWTIILLDCCAY